MITPPIVQLPLGSQQRPPAFISFSAEIVPQTSEVLMNAVTGLVNQGFTDVHLLLTTPGGIVALGIAIYNVLRGLPVTLTTHNVGNVDSIGAVIFLAGERRYACPQATFMLHGVSFTSPQPAQFFEKNLKERLASIQADHERHPATERSHWQLRVFRFGYHFVRANRTTTDRGPAG